MTLVLEACFNQGSDKGHSGNSMENGLERDKQHICWKHQDKKMIGVCLLLAVEIKKGIYFVKVDSVGLGKFW